MKTELNDLPAEPYLYELLEEYQNSPDEEYKNRLLSDFFRRIWENPNKRSVYTKTIRFQVKKNDLPDSLTGLFEPYSILPYTGYRSRTHKTDCYSLIRQKINNLYTGYFDQRVILNSDYLDCLKTPGRLYYRLLSGETLSPEQISNDIKEAMEKAGQLYARYRTYKMTLSWPDYQKLIEGFLAEIFRTASAMPSDCSFLEVSNDCLTEDHYYIRYFCKSLDGYLRKYQKQYYGIRDHKRYSRCACCGSLYEKTGRNQKYCPACAREKQLVRQRHAMRRARSM